MRQTIPLVLANDPRQGQLRQMSVLALVEQDRGTDFSQTGLAHLIATINKEYKCTFTSAQVKLDNLAVNANPAFNTKVRLSPASGQLPYSGSIELWYNRYVISDAFKGKDTSSFTIAQDTTVFALLPTINSQYGVNLVQGDVVDKVVKKADGGFVLDVAPSSYWFRSSSIQIGTPVDNSLSAAFTTKKLSGFDPA